MQLLIKQDDNSIVQSQILKTTGQGTSVNGMYTVASPISGLQVSLDNSSYILNAGTVDSGSVLTQMYDEMLAQFPTYNHVVFNEFVQLTDLDQINLTGTIPSPINPLVQETARYQTGRSLVAPTGIYANTVAVLAENSTTTPTKPGLLVTDNIDLSGFGIGSFTNFMVYWRIVELSTSHDVNSSSENTPAIRQVVEVDQEPATFSVYMSADGGTSYQEVNRLRAFTLVSSTSGIRLAFRNTSASKVYLAAYAILF